MYLNFGRKWLHESNAVIWAIVEFYDRFCLLNLNIYEVPCEMIRNRSLWPKSILYNYKLKRSATISRHVMFNETVANDWFNVCGIDKFIQALSKWLQNSAVEANMGATMSNWPRIKLDRYYFVGVLFYCGVIANDRRMMMIANDLLIQASR